MFDASSYMRIPFVERGRDRQGCDCWGLVRLVYLEQLGIEIEDLSEQYSQVESMRVPELVCLQQKLPVWRKVPQEEARCFDVVLCSGVLQDASGAYVRCDCHVGVVLTPGIMLNIDKKRGAFLCKYRSDLRIKHKITGFYRHVQCEQCSSCSGKPL